MSEMRYPKRLWIQLWLTILVILAITTNPAQEQHEHRLRTTAGADSPIISALVADHTTELELEYQNYILFSTTHVAGERTSFGLLGWVLTSSGNEPSDG